MKLEGVVGRLDTYIEKHLQMPVARAIEKKISANHVTIVGLVGSFLAAALIIAEAHLPGGTLVAGIVFLVASGLDVFDGSLARLQGTAGTSRLGAWLDAFTGSVSEACIFAALAFSTQDVGFLRIVVIAGLSTGLVSHVKSTAGEYGIVPDWREVRVVGRTVRVFLLSIGLVGGGALALDLEAELKTPLIALIGFNTLVLFYRTSKIIRQAHSETISFAIEKRFEESAFQTELERIARRSGRANGKVVDSVSAIRNPNH